MLIMGIERMQSPIVQGCLLLLLLALALALALVVGEKVVAEKAAKVAEAPHVCKVLALLLCLCACGWMGRKCVCLSEVKGKKYNRRKIGEI